MKDAEADFGAPLREHGYDYEAQNIEGHAADHSTGCVTFFRAAKFRAVAVQSRSRTFVVTLARRPDGEDGKDADTALAGLASEEPSVSVVSGASSAQARSPAAVALPEARPASSSDARQLALQQQRDAKAARRHAGGPRPHDDCVIVINVHLEGAPELHQKRFEQLKSVLHKTQPGVGRGSALFVVGDFNCGYKSSACRLLLDGKLPVRNSQPEPCTRVTRHDGSGAAQRDIDGRRITARTACS